MTLSFSQRRQKSSQFAKPFTLAITIARRVMFVCILIVAGAQHIPLLRVVCLPITAASVAALVYGVILLVSRAA